MLPYLWTELDSLLKALLRRFIKEKVLEEKDKVSKINHREKSNNWRPTKLSWALQYKDVDNNLGEG